MINERSGARVELDRNYPQTAEDRAFWVRGSRECVEGAKRMIEEKMQEQPVSIDQCFAHLSLAKRVKADKVEASSP